MRQASGRLPPRLPYYNVCIVVDGLRRFDLAWRDLFVANERLGHRDHHSGFAAHRPGPQLLNAEKRQSNRIFHDCGRQSPRFMMKSG